MEFVFREKRRDKRVVGWIKEQFGSCSSRLLSPGKKLKKKERDFVRDRVLLFEAFRERDLLISRPLFVILFLSTI